MQASRQTVPKKYGLKVSVIAAVLLVFFLIMNAKFSGDMREVYEFIDKQDCESALSAINDIEGGYGAIIAVLKILPLDSFEQPYRKSWQIRRECEAITQLKHESSLPEVLSELITNIKYIYEEIMDLKYPPDYQGVELPEIDKDLEFANSSRIKLFANAGVQLIDTSEDKLLEQLQAQKVSQKFCTNMYYVQNNGFSSKNIKESMLAFKSKLNSIIPTTNITCVQEILNKYNPEKSYTSIFNIKYGQVPIVTYKMIRMAINASAEKEDLERSNSLLVDFLSMHEKFCSKLRTKPSSSYLSLGTRSSEKITVGKDGKWLPHIQTNLDKLYTGCATSMLNKAIDAYQKKKYKIAKMLLDKVNLGHSNSEATEKANKYQVLVDIAIAKSQRAASLSPIKGRQYASTGPARVVLVNGSSSSLSIAMTGSETVKQQIGPCINCYKPEDRCKAQKNIASFILKPGDYNVLVKSSSPGSKVKPFVGVYELKEGHFYSQCYVIQTKQKKY